MIAKFFDSISALRRGIEYWLGTLVDFILAQGIIQFSGLLSSFIFVRFMPVEQYALYALSSTALSVVSIGCDLGLTSALYYFWRQSLHEGYEVGPKVAAVRRLRSALFVFALAIAALLLFSSAKGMRVTIAVIALCFGLVALTAFLQLHSVLSIHLMRLQGRQRLSYYGETAGSLVRMAAAGGMILTGIGTAWFGLVGGLLGAIATIGLVRSWTPEPSGVRDIVVAADWMELRRFLTPLLPSVAIYIVQDPLIYWLTATRIGPTAVAEVFALGRIAAVYAVVGTFVTVVIAPRLSRITNGDRYFRFSILCIIAIGAFATVVLAIAFFAPQLPLLLIGSQYSHLRSELTIALTSASMATFSAFFVTACRIRGWIALDPYFAMLHLSAILALCTFWRFDSTLMVLELTLLLAVSSLLCSVSVFAIGFLRPSLVTPAKNSVGDASESRPLEPR